MDKNKLYFIKDEYFEKYNIASINKTSDEESIHDRPCYYSFKENNILWMIPVSSRCEKYQKIYEKAIAKYNMCDAFVFGYVKGNKAVFLIQNMIPVIEKYIKNLYTFSNTENPIEVNDKIKRDINAKARKVLRFARNGKKLTFTSILELEKQLLRELETDTTPPSI